MAELLRSALEEEGYRTSVALNGNTALEMAAANTFDLMILDAMLPGTDGFSIARRLRQSGDQTPILMLTARDSNSDVIAGLNAGADDYVTKPFSLEVLLARVRAVSRRGKIPQDSVLRAADLILNPATREVRRSGRRFDLTPREFSLLSLLLRNKGRVVTRNAILDEVWGYEADVDGNTIEAFIRLLRTKIEPAPLSKLIFTIRGVGYSLKEEAHHAA